MQRTTSNRKGRLGLPTAFAALLFWAAVSIRAQTWQIISTPISYSAIACSADANTLYGLTSDSTDLYVSTNRGADWTFLRTFAGSPVSCSADGTKVATGSLPLVSTNWGASFTNELTPGNNAVWSASGNMLVVVGNGVSITTNNGKTWTTTQLKAGGLKHAAVSTDGALIVTATEETLYVSTNSGNSWSSGLSATNALWIAFACTADGTKIIAEATEEPSQFFVSNDSGQTWANEFPVGLPTAPFALTSSSDGGLLIADTAYGVYISRDFGASWTYDNASSVASVVCSADGTVIVATIGYNIGIQNLPPPLAIAPTAAPTAGQLTLSWPAPSSQYTLQQISDLSSTNWLPVTNAITVTNYRNQVILVPPATGNAFYRLQGPNP